MQVTVSNNIRLRGLSLPLRSAITQALTMPNPEYEKLKRMGRPTWGIPQRLELFVLDRGDLVAPRGFEIKLREILKAQGIRPEDVIRYDFKEFPRVDFGPWTGPPLRDYQQPAVQKVLQQGGGVLVSPAGSGKTLMGFKIIESWRQPTLWLTHTLDLLHQSADNAKAFLGGVGDIGIIGDGKVNWGSGKLFVATVQTLAANPTLVSTLSNLVGTVVVDEAHHFPARQFVETVAKFPARYLLGLTATPDRKDGLQRYMYEGLGPLAYEVKRDGMYEAGALILPEVKFVYTDFTRKSAEPDPNEAAENNVDAGGEDLDYTGLLKELCEDEARAQLVAENVLESCIQVSPKGGAVIVLADSVRYLFKLRNLVERFARVRLGVVPRMAVIHGGLQRFTWRKCSASMARQLGKSGTVEVRYNDRLRRWEYKDAQYSDEEYAAWQVTPAQRKAVLEQARARQIDILFATSQLVREGLDIPNLYAGHLATPQRGDGRNNKSGAGVEQAIGRIMRPDPRNPNKKATWYDYVDANDGTFYDQYLSRRKVYARLGISLPRKKKTQLDSVKDFLLHGLDLPL
jgi:superfamily II DNA or RNA helicase